MKKHLKKILIAVVAVIAAIGIYAVSINFYIKQSQSDKITGVNEAGAYDCILVLGCGIRADGTPSDMLLDRILTAVTLYENGAAPVIIMSGDHGSSDYNEVGVMKQYAVEYGVPSENIFLDHAGFSTYESIYRAKEIFGIESAIIVTQEYHLYRALYDAQSFGIAAAGCAADSRVYRGQTMRNIRELIARNKDFLFCIFNPEPTYLGDTIPLDGDGNATNG